MSRRFSFTSVALALALAACGGGGGGTTSTTGGGSGGTPPAVTVQTIGLVHNALAYDATRGMYYASIPGSVTGNGNRIARIDAASGAMSYSAAVGSEPWALAVAADGSALVVGLQGSGEVVKLSLPGLVEQWRVRLPTDGTFGQLLSERIAVSPVDPDVVAVSTVRSGVSPRHGGVVLIRAGTLQSRQTQVHTGANLIAFDAAGTHLYGFNNETSEFGLRRIDVLADGLAEAAVVTASGNFGTRQLDLSNGRVLLERYAYDTPAMALLGQSGTNTRGCRVTAQANRYVCIGLDGIGFGNGTLAVVDATSFVTLATPSFWTSPTNRPTPDDVVPGASGQVALRMEATYWNTPAQSLWLVNSAELP